MLGKRESEVRYAHTNLLDVLTPALTSAFLSPSYTHTHTQGEGADFIPISASSRPFDGLLIPYGESKENEVSLSLSHTHTHTLTLTLSHTLSLFHTNAQYLSFFLSFKHTYNSFVSG